MVFRELFPHESYEFYKNNPTSYLKTTAGKVAHAVYFGAFDSSKVIAATSYLKITDNLAIMQSTMVLPENRGQGVGRFLNEQLIEHLKEEGFGKIVSHIYVENLPSIILKLKLGYLIEGTLRDHDFAGQHEYILGKNIKEN